MNKWSEARGLAVCSIEALISDSSVVICCLPSSEAFVSLCETQLLGTMAPGQILMETGTTQINEIRRLATLLHLRNISFLDAPMSGGPWGVTNKKLHVFVGGSDTDYARISPVVAAYAGPEWVYHTGPVGTGQVAKGVNQLYMGLSNAICLEILSFSKNEGLDMEQVSCYFKDKFPPLARMARAISEGKGIEQGVKFRELPYYIHQAHERGYVLPITEELYSCCDQGERVTTDDHRHAPSYWNELNKRSIKP